MSKKYTRGIFGTVGFVGVVALVANFIKIKEGLFPKIQKPKIEINNSNFNKSPVITDSPGAAVNYFSEPGSERHLTPEEVEKFKAFLPPDNSVGIRIEYLASDDEAEQFAKEIKSYLESHNWKVEPFLGSFVPAETVKGVQIFKKDSEWLYSVGSNPAK